MHKGPLSEIFVIFFLVKVILCFKSCLIAKVLWRQDSSEFGNLEKPRVKPVIIGLQGEWCQPLCHSDFFLVM